MTRLVPSCSSEAGINLFFACAETGGTCCSTVSAIVPLGCDPDACGAAHGRTRVGEGIIKGQLGDGGGLHGGGRLVAQADDGDMRDLRESQCLKAGSGGLGAVVHGFLV